MLFDAMIQDLKYAMRGLRTRPGFTVAIALTLGLGIGANTAMFSVVDRLLFRAPPLMRDPSTAHQVYAALSDGKEESASGVGAYARFADLARSTSSFSSAAGYFETNMAVGVGDAARVTRVAAVSASFFGFFDAP